MGHLLSLFLDEFVPIFGLLGYTDQAKVLVVPDHSTSMPHVMEWITRHSYLAIIDMRTAQMLARQKDLAAEFEAERKEFGMRALKDRLYKTEGEDGGCHVVIVVSELYDKELIAEIPHLCEELGALYEIYKAPSE